MGVDGDRIIRPQSRLLVRHEVARVEWIHRLEVDDVEGVAQVRFDGLSVA
jgi:hypothetical protein